MAKLFYLENSQYTVYEFMVLEAVCLQDHKVKYEFIRDLKLHGLIAKCALLTYSHAW